MIQPSTIFRSAIFFVITSQICCPSSAIGLSNKRSINILIPIPYHSTFSQLNNLGNGMGNVGGGLAGLRGGPQSPHYFGYFTRYLGRANVNGFCSAGVNINGHCWYDSIGNNKR